MNEGAKAVRRHTRHSLHNALVLARAGIHVFPVGLRPLHPEGDGWKLEKIYYKGLGWAEKASTDPEAIATMFAEHPDSAVGVATGPSGLAVLDRDDLTTDVGKLPGTFVYPTARGGRHHWFRAPEGVEIKSQAPVTDADGVELPGVDIKAAGGMVVFYGKKLSGDELEFAPLPKRYRVERTAAGGEQGELDDAELDAWLRRGKRKPNERVRDAVATVPTSGASEGELFTVLGPVVRACYEERRGRGWAFDAALERWLEGAKDARKSRRDFIRAWRRLAAEYRDPTVIKVPKSERVKAEDGAALLDEVRAWLARFVLPMRESDLDLMTLWAAHTHGAERLRTSPRLQFDSPMPGSGKTTALEHLARLCLSPVQMASISSTALLVRILEDGTRTLLLDEVDRTLDPKRESTAEFLAIINSGYKVGATRPTLVPGGKGAWQAVEMPTFAPVALAGNTPLLPDDVRSRTLRILLVPDVEGRVEESDWEVIEADALRLGRRLASWVKASGAQLSAAPRDLPHGVIGRARERWLPLKRIAWAAGGHWPDLVDELAAAEQGERTQEIADGLLTERPAVVLLRHIAEVGFRHGEAFVATSALVNRLINHAPDVWGLSSSFGRPLTAQRLGRMLAGGYRIHSGKDEGDRRGYHRAKFEDAWQRFGTKAADEGALSSTVQTVQTVSTVQTASGSTSKLSVNKGKKYGLTLIALDGHSKPSKPSEPSKPSKRRKAVTS